MGHCAFCRRRDRALVYEGDVVNACAPCAVAVARFVLNAADATVCELWNAAADVDMSQQHVLEAFRAAVAGVVPENDAASHFALGIAYREMGLHTDATRELDLAVAILDRLSPVVLKQLGRHLGAIRAAADAVQHDLSAQLLALLFSRLTPPAVATLRDRLFVD